MRAGSHDPEWNAARYIGGEMSPRARRRLEAHVLGCEDCWCEVQLDLEGRRRSESLRELAPPSLRDDVRSAVLFSGNRRHRRPRLALVGIAIALILGGLVSLVLVERSTQPEPPAIAAALASYRADVVPAGFPARPAPDLRPVGLRLAESGRGSLGRIDVDAFAYRGPDGDLVYLFFSSSEFPTASGAAGTPGMTGGWSARSDDIAMICRSQPSSFLLIGVDAGLLERADAVLASGAAGG